MIDGLFFYYVNPQFGCDCNQPGVEESNCDSFGVNADNIVSNEAVYNGTE